MEADTKFGDRLADSFTNGIGSWKFIIIQTILTIAWITLNGVALIHHWDPYPWVLLNLVYSFQAGFTGPILLLSGNRQADLDRARAQKDLETDEQTLALLQKIAWKLDVKE